MKYSLARVFTHGHWNKALVCAGLLVGGARLSHAADFTVTNLNDSGAGSLRQAITDANTSMGDDNINFAAGLTGAITLSTGSIPVFGGITINGPGAGALAISGGGSSGILAIVAENGTTFRISGLTFRNALGNFGGAISAQMLPAGQQLVVDRCVFSNNFASTSGGAIHLAQNGRSLLVTDSEFTGNTAYSGGAISSMNATVTLRGSTIAGNTSNATMVGGGGGIILNGGSNSVISQCTVHGNTVSSANGFTHGGGIYLSGATGVSIINSTVTNNTAVSPNSYGGGISFQGGSLTLTNTIVSGNTVNNGATQRDIQNSNYMGAPVIAGTNNLIGAADPMFFAGPANGVNGNLVGTPANPINPLLGALQNNGGPTRTRLPQTGSPVLNAGTATSTFANDQRGAGFPRLVGSAVDIGAVELDSTAPTAALTPVANVVDTSPATSLQFNVVYTDDGAVLGTSLDSTDIRVTGPNGFNTLATFVSANPSTGGASVTATYSIVPPGGAWDVADNGVYTISVEGSQVLDGGGNAVAAGVLGYVMVGINGSGSGGAITITPDTGGNVTVGFNFPNPPSIPLTTTVDFGDGTTGAPGPHTYNQPGSYTVTITVTGGATPLTFTTTVTVNSTGGGNFRVRVSKIKLDDSGTDTITLTGVISVPSNIDYTGKTIDVNVGGATQTFTLDAKGSAKSANGKIKVAFPSNKKKKGTGDLQQVLVKTQFSGAFANAIKANTPKDTAGFPTVLPVRVLFNGQTYTQTLNVEFKTNTKGSGTRFGFF